MRFKGMSRGTLLSAAYIITCDPVVKHTISALCPQQIPGKHVGCYTDNMFSRVVLMVPYDRLASPGLPSEG